MIKKARINFITTTMIILLIIFWIMGTMGHSFLSRRNKNDTDAALNDIIYTYEKNSEETKTRSKSAVILSTNGEISDIIFDDSIFTEEDVCGYYNYAVESKIYKNNIENVYYKLIEKDDYQIFAAVDRSAEQLWVYKAFTIIVTILCISYLVLFLLVWILSYPMLEPIKQAFEKQTTFISDAGHELKTPLSIISSSVDVLKAENGDNEYLNNIKEQSRRMNFLISDLLSLTKLEERKNKPEIKEINLSNLINNVVLSFDSLAFEKNKRIDTDIEKNIVIRTDEYAVKQILQILLDNALKYATEGSTILCYLGTLNHKITIGVYNQCENVEAGTETKIFERFYRTDESRNRDTGGSGLGLAIAKRTADINGWKLYAEIEDKKSIAVCLQLN